MLEHDWPWQKQEPMLAWYYLCRTTKVYDCTGKLRKAIGLVAVLVPNFAHEPR